MAIRQFMHYSRLGGGGIRQIVNKLTITAVTKLLQQQPPPPLQTTDSMINDFFGAVFSNVNHGQHRRGRQPERESIPGSSAQPSFGNQRPQHHQLPGNESFSPRQDGPPAGLPSRLSTPSTTRQPPDGSADSERWDRQTKPPMSATDRTNSPSISGLVHALG